MQPRLAKSDAKLKIETHPRKWRVGSRHSFEYLKNNGPLCCKRVRAQALDESEAELKSGQRAGSRSCNSGYVPVLAAYPWGNTKAHSGSRLLVSIPSKNIGTLWG